MSNDQMFPRIMRAVQIGAFGGIGQLHLSSISVPTLRKGEVLVRVDAGGPPGMRWCATEGAGLH
jgi:hypothetical protein